MDKLEKAHEEGTVLGLQDVAGVTSRLDIDVLLLKHPETFNLFLIALMELKIEDVTWDIDDDYKVTKKDKMSYYKLAGLIILDRSRSSFELTQNRHPWSSTRRMG